MTVCGMKEGWDIIRCRTVTLEEAMVAWGKWFPLLLQHGRIKVGPYEVWIA